MKISQAVRDYLVSGETLVVMPASVDLPVPMSLGLIEDSRPNEKSPAHFELGARPWVPAQRLTHVYVIAVGTVGLGKAVWAPAAGGGLAYAAGFAGFWRLRA